MNTKKKTYTIADLNKPLTLAGFLRSWRLAEGLSQVEFAKTIGISAANLCDIEKKRKGVSIAKACEIANLIGYSPTALVQIAIQEQVNEVGLKFDVELKKRMN